MNLKLKFALLFASLVTMILIVSALVIFYLFSINRKEDFTERLRDEAMRTYRYYVRQNGLLRIQSTIEDEGNSLTSIQKLLLDSNYFVIGKYPDTLKQSLHYNFLKAIKEKQQYYFTDQKREGIGMYFPPGNNPSYVIVSAYDKFGKKKEYYLKIVLLAALLGGMILSVVFAFIFTRQLSKPLQKITKQIQSITASNLKDRFIVPPGYEELRFLIVDFNAMLDRIERAFEIQKSFVHNASHELRTPLAVMLSQTEAALNRDITLFEARQVLQSLKEDQQEMIELTNSLLLLSQYEKVQFSKEWPIVRMDEVIYDNIAMVKRMFPLLNVMLEFAEIPQDDVSLSIRGNDALLRSAIRNLLKNAYVYSSDKQVIVTIAADEKNIIIHFDNKGKQLSKSEQERLFFPFFRGENSASKKGFGLGLSIVKRIVAMHKGNIIYAARENSINRFTLIFPKYT